MYKEVAIHLCPTPTPEMVEQFRVVDGVAEVPMKLSTLETRLCAACNSVVTGFFFKEQEAISKWRLNKWETKEPLVLREVEEIVKRKKF